MERTYLNGWPKKRQPWSKRTQAKETPQTTRDRLPADLWKILTAQIREEIYYSLTSRGLFPEEQKGCRKWLIFSCDLLSLYPAVHFLSKWLRGIMAIMNSKGDRACPWNILLRIFTSVKLLPPAVNSILQVFMVFSIKFMTSSDI